MLANNLLRSLENQTNKNFELIFVAHEKFFEDKKYEFIFTKLRNSTTLPIKFMQSIKEIPLGGKDVPILITDALDKYDFVIQSRIDFDDFVYKGAIEDTQNKVNECDSILYYGYCRGYTYVYGELYPFYYTGVDKMGHIGVLQSVILKSSFAKKMPFFARYGLHHGKVKLITKKFVEENGVAFSESMFQQNLSTNAFIYFRHEDSQEQLVKYANRRRIKTPEEPKLTTADITKKQLEEEFGFFCELNSIK